MKNNFEYVIITPVRDEVKYVEKTVTSVIIQTILPNRWVIVDDGSTDGTRQLLKELTLDYNWIHVVHREDRGFRFSGSGVIEAFYDGYALLNDSSWNFIVKLDGDLSFPPEYFEKCMNYFKTDKKLGIAGGTIYVLKNGKLKIDSTGDPPFHVRGATKIYRKTCWEQISPLVKYPGWDTIDEVKANMLGWNTQTFRNLGLIQHKATGEADGCWRNLFKNGIACYITGYHPLFMLGKCIKRIYKQPYIYGSVALWVGFCSGYIKKMPQANDYKTLKYLRQQQLRKIIMRKSIYG